MNHFCVCSQSFAAADLASRADVVRILRDERFELVHRVREISARDWATAGVLPQGRSITAFMVDPGKSYQKGDIWRPDQAIRQLLVAATNPSHEVLCFWEGTQGGPALSVLMIKRGKMKSALIFYAIMNNDIPQRKWTWKEVKQHIRDNKMDVLISAEHPGTYDNRLP